MYARNARCLLKPIGRPVLAAALLLTTALLVGKPGAATITIVLWFLTLATTVAAVLPTGLSGAIAAGLRVLRAWLRGREGMTAVALIAAGTALRLWDLDGFPTGIHGDEAELALIAQTILQGSGPAPFGTAFLGDPALFLYFEAPFLAVFGPTVTAMRLLAALSGALTLPAFYLLIRQMFGPRPAILGLTLLVGSAVHIHFSRIALNSAEVPLLMCLSAHTLWNGYVTRQAYWWLVSGMSAAVAIYFNFAGRVTPVVIGAFVLYLLVAKRGPWRACLRGAGVALAGGAIALAPMGIQLANDPHQFTAHMTSRLIFANWEHVSATHHSSHVAQVLLGQTKINLLAFLSNTGDYVFYPFPGATMLPRIIGPLFVLGLVLMLIRLRDPRCAMLTCFFWITLIVNGVLTNDPPQTHRLLPTLLPALAGAALSLNWLAEIAGRRIGRRSAEAVFGGGVLVAILAGHLDCNFYFGPAAEARPWELVTTQARYVASLGPSYRVHYVGTPPIGYAVHGTTRFLAPDVASDSTHNPAVELPVPAPADRDLAILVFPHTSAYLPLYRSAYPSATIEIVRGHTGETFFTALLVPRFEVARWQGLTAHYDNQIQMETNAGHLGGGATRYPASVAWSGSLYVEEAGRYSLRTEGVASEMRVDGVALGGNEERELAIGWHSLEIKATLPTPDTAVALVWQIPGQPFAMVPAHMLDARTLAGSLRGTLVTNTTAMTRRDRAIGFRNVADLIGHQQPVSLIWEGALNVSVAGLYGFALNSDGEAEVSIDRAPLIATQAPIQSGAPPRARTATATAHLTAGAHPCVIRYEWRQPPGILELLWTPPDEPTSIIPPEAFRAP